MLDQKAIDEFKQIYKKECGIKLENGEARRMAEELMELFKLIYCKGKNRKNV